jgi:hypothetical protein
VGGAPKVEMEMSRVLVPAQNLKNFSHALLALGVAIGIIDADGSVFTLCLIANDDSTDARIALRASAQLLDLYLTNILQRYNGITNSNCFHFISFPFVSLYLYYTMEMGICQSPISQHS